MRIGTFVVATSSVFALGTAGVSSAALAQRSHPARLDASSKAQTHHGHHKPQQATAGPCLEGKWNVTSITLSTSGLTFSGGAGTTVNILANGNALGNFTPGTPLVGSEGSAKFNGTVTDHYAFTPKTTARSGTFPVTTVSDDATITVAGATRPVTSSPEQGAYTCTAKDLSLTFTSGASTLSYQMTPAG